MCVNKIKFKSAYKNNHLSLIREHSRTFLKVHTMRMGQLFLAILGHLLLINAVRNDFFHCFSFS